MSSNADICFGPEYGAVRIVPAPRPGDAFTCALSTAFATDDLLSDDWMELLAMLDNNTGAQINPGG